MEAEVMFTTLKKRLASESHADDIGLAYAYTGLSEKDRAMAYPKKEYEIYGTAMTSLKSNPWYDSLRSDPRFVDLMRRVNLASNS